MRELFRCLADWIRFDPRRRRTLLLAVLGLLFLGLFAGFVLVAVARGAEAAEASPLAYLASPYLADDATDWDVRIAPSMIRVHSPRPIPPEAEWRGLAELVVCSTLAHPFVVRGLLPFDLPTVVEFHQGEDGAGPRFGRVVIERVACGAGT